MAWPYDDLPPEEPMDIRQAPPLDYGPIGLPDSFGGGMDAVEPPPQHPDPSGYWLNLARGGGIQVPHFQSPTGLEVILSALAGFANQKAAMAQHGASETEKKNALLRESASNLAKQRWEQRKLAASQEAARATLQSNEAYRRDVLGETRKHNRAMEARPSLAAPSGRYGVGGDPASWADLIIKGQADLSNVPLGIRNQVADAIGGSGETLVPKKARDTIGALNAASAIVDQLEGMSSLVPRGTGVGGRLIQGAKNIAGAMTQSNTPAAQYNSTAAGVLANLARAMGERGVLTDQDIARVQKQIPTLRDSRELERSKFKALRELLAEFQQRAVRTYTTKGAGLGTSPTNQPAKVRYRMDAQGNLVPE